MTYDFMLHIHFQSKQSAALKQVILNSFYSVIHLCGSYILLLHNEIKYSLLFSCFDYCNICFQHKRSYLDCAVKYIYLGASGQDNLNCQLCHLKRHLTVLHEQIIEELNKAMVLREKSQTAF